MPPVTVAVPREVAPDERRVALVPEAAAGLVKLGLRIVLEAGAGEAASCRDRDYEQAGAELLPDAVGVWGAGDVVLKVRPPVQHPVLGRHEVDLAKPGAVLIAFLYPERDPGLLPRLQARQVTGFALERVPRLSRAQHMDALSSQSTVAGYLAVILAAQALPKFFPLLMTAAGTVPPARVLIVGAGVAGLQAIATARRLGARVEAFDVRPEVKEQVESLGAAFVGLGMADAVGGQGYARELSQDAHRRVQELLQARVREADVVIASALVPGVRAPVLLTAEMVRGMHPGSVIVDLAAEQGGNCAVTEPGETIVWEGVTVLGPVHLPSRLPLHASQLYARNVSSFLTALLKDGALSLDLTDPILRETCVTHRGQVVATTSGAAAGVVGSGR